MVKTQGCAQAVRGNRHRTYSGSFTNHAICKLVTPVKFNGHLSMYCIESRSPVVHKFGQRHGVPGRPNENRYAASQHDLRQTPAAGCVSWRQQAEHAGAKRFSQLGVRRPCCAAAAVIHGESLLGAGGRGRQSHWHAWLRAWHTLLRQTSVIVIHWPQILKAV